MFWYLLDADVDNEPFWQTWKKANEKDGFFEIQNPNTKLLLVFDSGAANCDQDECTRLVSVGKNFLVA